MTEEIMKILDGEVFSVWFLIGAALVWLHPDLREMALHQNLRPL